MKVGILAGGLGSRLSEETRVRPKPMVEIGGKPMLWHIMNHYMHYGFNEFVVALGYRGEDIKKYFVEYHLYAGKSLSVEVATGKVEFLDESGPPEWQVELVETGAATETGGRLKKIAPFMGSETFMLTYGDGVSNVNIPELIEFHRSHGKLATLTAVHPPNRFGRLNIEGDKVADFAEKPQFAGEKGPQRGEGWINGGFFVLEPEVADYIETDDMKWELEPLSRLAKDGELMAYHHYDFWQCMDTLRDKTMLESLCKSGKPPWRRWKD